jgi:hypothetical protein
MFCFCCQDSSRTRCHAEVLLLVERFGVNTLSSRRSVAGVRIRAEHGVIQRFCCWWKDLVWTHFHPEFLLLVEGFGVKTLLSRGSVAGGKIRCEHTVIQRFCCRWEDSVWTHCHPGVLLLVEGFGVNTVESRCSVAGARSLVVIWRIFLPRPLSSVSTTRRGRYSSGRCTRCWTDPRPTCSRRSSSWTISPIWVSHTRPYGFSDSQCKRAVCKIP